MEPVKTNETTTPVNPLFPVMGIGSLLYALLYTICLYHNPSGISYPFYIGGTCLFFCFFRMKSPLADSSCAGSVAMQSISCKGNYNRILTPMTIFDLSSLMLLALSVCFTDSSYLILLGKTLIFFLLLHLFLHSFYEDRHWDIFTYIWAMIKTVFSSLAFLARPFTDLTAYVKNRRNIQTSHTDNRRVLSIVIGLTVALLALPVILLLLGSADAVFANLFQDAWNVFEGIKIHGDILTILVMFLFGFFLSYCLLCRLQTPNLKEAPSCQKEDPVIAITFTSIFSVIYVLFCMIQIVYLFAGLGILPENYTYASYARAGFFQLVFVCLINLVSVLLCIRLFRPHRILQLLLSVVSLCTFVMIASSAYRMLLYISVYHLTVLRVFVLWSLLVISFLMVGTLILIYKPAFPFVRYGIIVVTVLFLLYSFSRPDYRIARYNISHAAKDDYALTYLCQLSADAAPVVLGKLPEESDDPDDYYLSNLRQEYVDYLSDCTSDLSIRSFNFSRWKAKKLLGN